LIDTATGREVVRVLQDVNEKLSFSYWDGSAYQVVTGTHTVVNDQLYRQDVRLKIDNGSGSIELYIDGSIVASFSGDTLNDDFTQIDRVRFESDNNILASLSAGLLLSAVVIADEDTRPIRVKTLHVTGNGSNTDWNSDYTSVDEALLNNDNDAIASDAANEVETFALADVGLTDYLVAAVSVNMRAQRGIGGPQNIQAAVRVDGTNYFSGNLAGLGNTHAPFWNIFDVSPDTSAAWTLAEVDALEAGVKSIS
jgi:hypothetical protein